jgi:hypothetical protein
MSFLDAPTRYLFLTGKGASGRPRSRVVVPWQLEEPTGVDRLHRLAHSTPVEK